MTSAALVAVYFLVHVAGAHANEAAFWQERRTAARQLRPAATGTTNPWTDLPPVSAVTYRETAAATPPVPAAAAHIPFTKSSLQDALAPFGQVVEFHKARDPQAPWIIHTQDLHGDIRAQDNLAKIYAQLSSLWGVSVIGLEGASGVFPLDRYRVPGRPDETRTLARYALSEHIIGGAEFQALTAPTPVTLWGAEDPALYVKNIQTLPDGAARDSELAAFRARLDGALNALKRDVFSPALQNWDKLEQDFARQEIRLGDYAGGLLALSNGAGSFPEIQSLARAHTQESSIRFERVEKERGVFLEELGARLSPAQIQALLAEAAACRQGRLSVGQFHQRLKAVGSGLSPAVRPGPQLSLYIDYAAAAERIDPRRLLDELDAAREAIPNALCRTAEERKLLGWLRAADLLGKLQEHRLTPGEWARLAAREADVAALPKAIGEFVGGRGGEAPWSLSDLAALIQPHLDFCRLAFERNAALTDNLLSKMAEEKAALGVLVAGGFHTPGLSEIWKERGVSYVVITPRVDKVDAAASPLGLFVAPPLPLEKMFRGEPVAMQFPRVTAGRDPEGLPAAVRERVLALRGWYQLARLYLIGKTTGGRQGEKAIARAAEAADVTANDIDVSPNGNVFFRFLAYPGAESVRVGERTPSRGGVALNLPDGTAIGVAPDGARGKFLSILEANRARGAAILEKISNLKNAPLWLIDSAVVPFLEVLEIYRPARFWSAHRFATTAEKITGALGIGLMFAAGLAAAAWGQQALITAWHATTLWGIFAATLASFTLPFAAAALAVHMPWNLTAHMVNAAMVRRGKTFRMALLSLPVADQRAPQFRLVQLISVINKLLAADKDGLTEDFYRAQDIAKFIAERPVQKEDRLDTYFERQAATLYQAMVEAVDNGQDASRRDARISGRLGEGAKQVFGELEPGNGTFILESSKDGLVGVRFEFWHDGREVVGRYEILTGTPEAPLRKGTRHRVDKKFGVHEVAERRAYLERKFRINTRSRILDAATGERINHPENYRYVNATLTPRIDEEVAPVQVSIDETGWEVVDNGRGMGLKEILEKYLPPHRGEHGLEEESVKERQKEVRCFYKPGDAQPGAASDVALVLVGREHESFSVDGKVNIVPEVLFELPRNTPLTPDRSKISLLPDSPGALFAIEGMKDLINKLADPSRDMDRGERIAVINTLAAVLRAKQRGAQNLTRGTEAATDLLWYLRDTLYKKGGFLDGLKKDFLFLPNDAAWARFLGRDDVILLDADLLTLTEKSFENRDIFSQVPENALAEFQKKDRRILTVDFGDRGAIAETPFLVTVVVNSAQYVLIDRRVFEKEESRETLAAYLRTELPALEAPQMQADDNLSTEKPVPLPSPWKEWWKTWRPRIVRAAVIGVALLAAGVVIYFIAQYAALPDIPQASDPTSARSYSTGPLFTLPRIPVLHILIPDGGVRDGLGSTILALLLARGILKSSLAQKWGVDRNPRIYWIAFFLLTFAIVISIPLLLMLAHSWTSSIGEAVSLTQGAQHDKLLKQWKWAETFVAGTISLMSYVVFLAVPVAGWQVYRFIRTSALQNTIEWSANSELSPENSLNSDDSYESRTPSFGEGNTQAAGPKDAFGTVQGLEKGESIIRNMFPRLGEDGKWKQSVYGTFWKPKKGSMTAASYVTFEILLNVQQNKVYNPFLIPNGILVSVTASQSMAAFRIERDAQNRIIFPDYTGPVRLRWQVARPRDPAEMGLSNGGEFPLPPNEVRDIPADWRAALDEALTKSDSAKHTAIAKIMKKHFVYTVFSKGLNFNGTSWMSAAAEFVERGERIPVVCNTSSLYYYIMARYVGLPCAYAEIQLHHKGTFYRNQRLHAQAVAKLDGHWQMIETTALIPFELPGARKVKQAANRGVVSILDSYDWVRNRLLWLAITLRTPGLSYQDVKPPKIPKDFEPNHFFMFDWGYVRGDRDGRWVIMPHGKLPIVLEQFGVPHRFDDHLVLMAPAEGGDTKYQACIIDQNGLHPHDSLEATPEHEHLDPFMHEGLAFSSEFHAVYDPRTRQFIHVSKSKDEIWLFSDDSAPRILQPLGNTSREREEIYRWDSSQRSFVFEQRDSWDITGLNRNTQFLFRDKLYYLRVYADRTFVFDPSTQRIVFEAPGAVDYKPVITREGVYLVQENTDAPAVRLDALSPAPVVETALMARMKQPVKSRFYAKRNHINIQSDDDQAIFDLDGRLIYQTMDDMATLHLSDFVPDPRDPRARFALLHRNTGNGDFLELVRWDDEGQRVYEIERDIFDAGSIAQYLADITERPPETFAALVPFFTENFIYVDGFAPLEEGVYLRPRKEQGRPGWLDFSFKHDDFYQHSTGALLHNASAVFRALPRVARLQGEARRNFIFQASSATNWFFGLSFCDPRLAFFSRQIDDNVRSTLDGIARAAVDKKLQDFTPVLRPIFLIYFHILPIDDNIIPEDEARANAVAFRYLTIVLERPELTGVLLNALMQPVDVTPFRSIQPISLLGTPEDQWPQAVPSITRFFLRGLLHGFEDLLKEEPELSQPLPAPVLRVASDGQSLAKLTAIAAGFDDAALDARGGLQNLKTAYEGAPARDYDATPQAKAVNNQEKGIAVAVKELGQNGRDAVREGEQQPRWRNEIEHRVQIRSYTNNGRWIVSVRDPLGMRLSRLVKYLFVPDATTKTLQKQLAGYLLDRAKPGVIIANVADDILDEFFEDIGEARADYAARLLEILERPRGGVGLYASCDAIAEDITVLWKDHMKSRAAGFFGQGFFTSLNQEVLIRTEVDGRLLEIRLTPVRDPKTQEIVDILTGDLIEYADPSGVFQGTEIQMVRHFSEDERPKIALDNAFLRFEVLRYLGGISDCEILWNGENIADPMEILAAVPRAQAGLADSRINRAMQDEITIEEPFWPGVPPGIARRLQRLGWNLKLDRNAPVVRARTRFMNPQGHTGRIATLALLSAGRLYREGRLAVDGLPTYAEYQNASPWNEPAPPAEMREQAERIRSFAALEPGAASRAFWREFTEGYARDEDRWAHLMTLVDPALADERAQDFRAALPPSFAAALDAARAGGAVLHAPSVSGVDDRNAEILHSHLLAYARLFLRSQVAVDGTAFAEWLARAAASSENDPEAEQLAQRIAARQPVDLNALDAAWPRVLVRIAIPEIGGSLEDFRRRHQAAPSAGAQALRNQGIELDAESPGLRAAQKVLEELAPLLRFSRPVSLQQLNWQETAPALQALSQEGRILPILETILAAADVPASQKARHIGRWLDGPQTAAEILAAVTAAVPAEELRGWLAARQSGRGTQGGVNYAWRDGLFSLVSWIFPSISRGAFYVHYRWIAAVSENLWAGAVAGAAGFAVFWLSGNSLMLENWSALSWGFFFGSHVWDFFKRPRGARPPAQNMAWAGLIATVNIVLGFSPVDMGGFAVHLAANGLAWLIARARRADAALAERRAKLDAVAQLKILAGESVPAYLPALENLVREASAFDRVSIDRLSNSWFDRWTDNVLGRRQDVILGVPGAITTDPETRRWTARFIARALAQTEIDGKSRLIVILPEGLPEKTFLKEIGAAARLLRRSAKEGRSSTWTWSDLRRRNLISPRSRVLGRALLSALGEPGDSLFIGDEELFDMTGLAARVVPLYRIIQTMEHFLAEMRLAAAMA